VEVFSQIYPLENNVIENVLTNCDNNSGLLAQSDV